MARPLRLDAPGEFFHVLARGNGRCPIFEDDRDRETFLDLVTEIVERFDVRCHGFCLMDNHYHLLLQPMGAGLPRAIRHLNGVYAQRFNRRHGRSGHVFEGRYKCLLVDAPSYLLELARYIVLNPVRAGLVATPEAWPWSSFRATAGLAPAPRFLSVDVLRRAAGGRGGTAGASDFRDLVAIATAERGRDAAIEALLDHGAVAGPRPFVERVARDLMPESPSIEIPVEQRLVGRPSLAELLGRIVSQRERDARIRSAVLEHRYAQTDVARALGLSRSTVSRAIRGAGNECRPRPGE